MIPWNFEITEEVEVLIATCETQWLASRQYGAVVWVQWMLESECLGTNPVSTGYKLCDFMQLVGLLYFCSYSYNEDNNKITLKVKIS